MRTQRILLLLVSIFLLAFTEATAQQRGLILDFAPGVLEELNEIRAESRNSIKNKEIEDVRCLLGNKKGNRVYITGLYRPTVLIATYSWISTGPSCPKNTGRKTVGWWHNHPNGLCVLSESDQKVSKRIGFPITMLHCSDKKWAWWSIGQILSRVDERVFYPLPKQDLVNNNPK